MSHKPRGEWDIAKFRNTLGERQQMIFDNLPEIEHHDELVGALRIFTEAGDDLEAYGKGIAAARNILAKLDWKEVPVERPAMSEKGIKEILVSLIRVKDMADNKVLLFSNQGQALDGISERAEYRALAERARAALIKAGEEPIISATQQSSYNSAECANFDRISSGEASDRTRENSG